MGDNVEDFFEQVRFVRFVYGAKLRKIRIRRETKNPTNLTSTLRPCFVRATQVMKPLRLLRFVYCPGYITANGCDACMYVQLYVLETGHACLVPPGLDGHTDSSALCIR